ncbi:MAG: hypothetical protein PHQ28_07810 [Mycobacterium sp.]|nr:hypothetical protein [Mycobacterium sp.]
MRVEQAGEREWLEVFLPTPDVNNLVEMLTENLEVWGWRPPPSRS